MNKYNHIKHPITVTTCFIEHDGQLLVLQRARKDAQFGLWGIPGGKLDKGESPESALIREVEEETGINCSEDQLAFLNKKDMLNPHDGQYTLFMFYLNLESLPNIQIDPKEHSSFQWVSLENFKKLDLLYSQGIAFEHVRHSLEKHIQNIEDLIHV